MVSNKTEKWSKRKLSQYSILTIALLIILLELIFRILFHFQYLNLHTSISIQGNTMQVSDSLLVFKNEPFYVDYFKRFQFNEDGMKSAVGDVFIKDKTSNDFWVLLTGGSAMEGMGSNKDGQWLDITAKTDHPYNETIAFYLQELLQKQMPEKKVKVFNAANSSYTVYQSYWRYMSLADKIKPDWVVSMDGVNDPPTLNPGANVRDGLLKDWYSYPQFHYPLKFIVPVTRASAFVNAMKQKLFHIKQNYRLKKARNDNFPERKNWAAVLAPPIQWAVVSPQIKNAVTSFNTWITKYDSTLQARQIKHLLLIQPHMSFRDTANLCLTEKALDNYYRATFQSPALHSFLWCLYRNFPARDTASKIFPMTSIQHWPEWVFLDYCHFTTIATKKIAEEIFNYIISNGAQKPFQ